MDDNLDAAAAIGQRRDSCSANRLLEDPKAAPEDMRRQTLSSP